VKGRLCFAAATLLFALVAGAAPVLAGPPFRTDDPEPVDYGHWEFYAATQYQNDKDGVSGTAPHLELNYGIAPDLQFHLLVPDAYDRPKGGPTLFGLGDTELGVKYRFIQEGEYVPMVATFPLLELPTGSRTRGLGSGRAQLFLPIWLQKSWGPWASYGGVGYWINPGTGNRNYWYAGWLLQRDLSKRLTVGAEVFHTTPSAKDGRHETGYNIGAMVNVTESHHFIGSAGTDIHGPASSFFYMAYLMTWGPPEKGGEGATPR
jgi:hypothetical protein